MLAHQPDTTPAAATTVAPHDLSEEVRQWAEEYLASPEFRNLSSFDKSPPVTAGESSFGDFTTEPLFDGPDTSPFLSSPLFGGDMDDFGTSPMDTPYSEFMPTPLMGEDDDALFTSPLLGGDLFGGAFDDFAAPPTSSAKPVTALATQQLWTMTGTPVLEPADTVVPAATTRRPTAPPAPQAARGRPGPTGTRKHLTPEALIPLDAPTQKRTYATPSATSRKAVPAAIAKKRAHAVAFPDADDDDDDVLEPLSPTASEQEIIEHKRRQNTIAARRSRKRKFAHQKSLEDAVGELRADVARWRERALMAQEMLRAKGLTLSFE